MFGLEIGLIESEYFAAVAIHAGALPPDSYNVIDFATRSIPFAIISGLRDPYFPIESVRATRDELKKRRFIVELTEVPYHTHDYYSTADATNNIAWEFLRKYALAEDAKFTEYANMK